MSVTFILEWIFSIHYYNRLIIKILLNRLDNTIGAFNIIFVVISNLLVGRCVINTNSCYFCYNTTKTC